MSAGTSDTHNFTDGPILSKLIRFSGPVLFALLLQATYGAVDLLIVGQFASSADVSAVATGSNIMMTLTGPLSSFAIGITVLLGRQIGSGHGKECGRIAGAGIDVYEMEPPVSEDHPLLHAKNTVCTPHVAFASNEAMEKRAVIVCRNLKAWLDGAPENVVS